MSDEKKKAGFGSGFGSGAIIMLIVAAGYVFGFQQQPLDAAKTSVRDVNIAAISVQNLCSDLLKKSDLTAEQKDALTKGQAEAQKIIDETKKVAVILGIDLSVTTALPVTEPETEAKEVEEKVVEEPKVEEKAAPKTEL